MGLVLIAGLSLATTGAALAAQETLIYNGDLGTAPAPITLGSWGSGTIQEVTEVQFQGLKSLKLTSQGGFQGGRLDFKTPVDISGYAGQPNAYIEIWVRPYYQRPAPAPATTTPATGQPQPATKPGAVTGQRRATPGIGFGRSRATGTYGLPGARTTPGRVYQPTVPGTRSTYGRTVQPYGQSYAPGYGQPYAPGYGQTRSRVYGYGQTRNQPYTAPYTGPSSSAARRGVYGRQGTYARRVQPQLRKAQAQEAPKPETPAQTGPAPIGEAQFRTGAFRVQLVTDKGSAVLSDYPIYPGDRDPSGWVRVGFPLREFKGPIGDKLNRIVIFDERPDIVYIGAMRLVLDTTPLEARPTAYPAMANVGQAVTFMLNASAGLAPVQAVWDFNKADGIQEQATGARVMNVYDQPGDYEATVAVADATGANPEKRTYAVLVRVK
jgi:hypothetical protein